MIHRASRFTGRTLLDVAGRCGLFVEKLVHRPPPRVYYIVEDRSWATEQVGLGIGGRLRLTAPHLRFRIVTQSAGLFESVVHFGSIWAFAYRYGNLHGGNQAAVTFFHGHRGMGEAMNRAIDLLVDNIDRLGRVIVSCNLMKARLRQWGIADHKMALIPIGVDTDVFGPPTSEQRQRERARLGVPPDRICIGSFQKDGNGWGEGLEPKLIKGPDLFLEAVKRLASVHPVFILLSGPARGYVKKGLEAAGIPYCHKYVRTVAEVASFYHCLDLYLVTSREEGGPQAVLESMACGVPFVSTRVGMAIDIVKHGTNGMLANVEDVDAIVNGAVEIIENKTLVRKLTQAGFATAGEFCWANIADQCWHSVYAPLLEQLPARNR
jgi:glycosyltransferase involved in cell wall biosynthesis